MFLLQEVLLTCPVCPARRLRIRGLRRASVRTRQPTSTGHTDRFPRDSRATCARQPRTLVYPRGSLKHKQNPSVSEGKSEIQKPSVSEGKSEIQKPSVSEGKSEIQKPSVSEGKSETQTKP